MGRYLGRIGMVTGSTRALLVQRRVGHEEGPQEQGVSRPVVPTGILCKADMVENAVLGEVVPSDCACWQGWEVTRTSQDQASFI